MEYDFERRVEQVIDRRVFNRSGVDTLMTMFRMNEMIDSRVQSQVPGVLNDQLAKILPLYIENHSFIQKILDNHLPKVEKRIEETTRAIIARLVCEEQYRTVNGAFLEDLRQRYDADLRELRSQMNFLTGGWITTSLLTCVAGAMIILRE